MLLSCNNVNKSYGETKILSNISFNIKEKEKIALVGVNGAGKSTLFKLIIDEIQPDDGEINLDKNIKLGYFSQNLELNNEKTIFEELLTVFLFIIEKENKLKSLENKMNDKNLNENEINKLAEEYNKLHEFLNNNNKIDYKGRIKRVLKGLGFSEKDLDKKINSISGGQKTRVALSKIILKSPDLLLLDEPTNHLDIKSINWLESFLKNYDGAILIISHDRYFLNKVISKVIELENTKINIYNGNYNDYYIKKKIKREIELKHYINQQKEIKKQEESIKKLRSFNREKSIKRAESKEKALAKINIIEKPENLPDKMKITLIPKKESGQDVLEVTEVSKSFSFNLFRNISFSIKKGEKVALIGKNGIGKSTILKMILNNESYDTGNIKIGSNVCIGYYDQEQDNLDVNKTIFEEISDSFPHLTNAEIRSTLALFIFKGDDIFKTISTLSGGEKGRLIIAKIMLSNANFLILDEPTNHLDIVSKEILETAINNYTGTCLYISHDRYFINNTATKIIELTQEKMYTYLGDYEYYLQKISENNHINDYTKFRETPIQKKENKKIEWKLQKEEQAKIRKKQNDLKKIEKEIENFEEKIKQLNYELSLEEVYTDLIKTREIFEEKTRLEENLSILYENWEKLI